MQKDDIQKEMFQEGAEDDRVTVAAAVTKAANILTSVTALLEAEEVVYTHTHKECEDIRVRLQKFSNILIIKEDDIEEVGINGGFEVTA